MLNKKALIHTDDLIDIPHPLPSVCVSPEVDDFILFIDQQDYTVAILDGGVGGLVVRVVGHEEVIAVSGAELEGVLKKALIVGSFFVPAEGRIAVGGFLGYSTLPVQGSFPSRKVPVLIQYSMRWRQSRNRWLPLWGQSVAMKNRDCVACPACGETERVLLSVTPGTVGLVTVKMWEGVLLRPISWWAGEILWVWLHQDLLRLRVMAVKVLRGLDGLVPTQQGQRVWQTTLTESVWRGWLELLRSYREPSTVVEVSNSCHSW